MNIIMANLFDIVSLEFPSPTRNCSLLEALSIGLCKLYLWVLCLERGPHGLWDSLLFSSILQVIIEYVYLGHFLNTEYGILLKKNVFQVI